ncbi:MAG TPA: ATPase [Kiloniellales bacterium]|nr:ATPase [Kiloniellales bacterium]
MLRISTIALAGVTLAFAAAPALAQESGGLPQLTQTETFASQIFWLVITFGALYYIMSRKVLPRLGEAVEGRREKIEDDLGRAERLRAEAEEVMGAYEKALSTARSEAGEILKEVSDEIKAETTQRLEVFGREQAERSRSEEAAIEEAMQRASGELAAMASDVAQSVTQKLIEVTPDPTAARAAVEEVMEARR